MIIKRTEKEGIVKVIYQSSNILASTYDKASKKLTIIFNKGGQYLYNNVDEMDYLRLELAESVGKTFNSLIKNTYSFEKLEDADINLINEDVNQTMEIAIKGMTESVRKEMDTMIKFIDEFNIIEDYQIKNLELTIKKYKEIKGIKNE